MKALARLAIALSAIALTGCQLEDLTEDTAQETEEDELVYPVGHGQGTQLRPYTPDDLLAGKAESGQQVWVMGYAVGSTYRSLSNAIFSVPTTYESNILLANDTLCTDAAQCIAVELSTSTIKEQFALSNQPQRLHQLVVFQGTAGTYFSQAGLRQAATGYWFPDYFPSLSDTGTEEWEENENTY